MSEELGSALPDIPPLRDLGLQFLHVPTRPGSNRLSRRVLSASSVKPPIPVYTMKRDELDRTPAVRLGSAHSARVTGSAGPGIRVPSARMVVQEDPNVVSWDSPRVASATRNVEPPLFVAIKRYLDKELAIATSSCDETGMDMLLPHREAFRMIIEGFPTYAPILCSIMGAYDGALRYYADIVSSARGASTTLEQSEACHRNEIEIMSRKIQELEKRAQSHIPTGKVLDAARKLSIASGFRTGGSTGSDETPGSPTTVRTLQNQVKALEKEHSDDLEKMITLIHAVKESESRSKYLEDTLQTYKSQVDSIPRLKKELADSIAEITQLRDTFRDSVPLSRYTATKSDLESAVQELGNEVKRVRRVCAARGSQVEALQKVVDSTRSEYVLAKARKLRDQLSPRPSWSAIHQKVPDLKELTSPLPAESTTVGEAGTIVEFPSSTIVQVGYLVDQLTKARATIASLEQALADAQALAAAVALEAGPTPASTPHGSLHDAAVAGIPLTKSESGASPMHRETYRPSTSPSTSGDHGAAAYGDTASSRKISALTNSETASQQSPHPTSVALASGLLKPPTMPLLAYGTGPTVPCYLRAVGLVRRRSLDHARLRELTYDFFDMGLRNLSAPLDSTSVGQLFLTFLDGVRTSQPDLREAYSNATTLCYNFVESAQREGMLRADPMIQCLLAMLSGAVPGRIANDAVGVVDAVKKEIQLLAEGLQRNRVRRSAIMEVTAPLLVYKDREELEDLRTSLGVESTIDIPTLLFRRSKFTEVLFEQEIVGGLKLYTSFVQRLTELSEVRPDGRMMVSTSNVLQAIVYVEPKTPQAVILMMIPDTTQEELHSVESILSALAKAPLVRRSPPIGPPVEAAQPAFRKSASDGAA
jgi:hypothetical protein